MVIVVDNYDSFTMNLVHALGVAGAESTVIAHDAIEAEELLGLEPRGIVLSAGPCTPREAGVSVPLVRALLERRTPGPPLLGVCLGHQCIAAALGVGVRRAREPLHGRTSSVTHDARGLFEGMPNPLVLARYNSLVIEALGPGPLEACAWDEIGDVMAIRHTERAIEGVQFHPESHLSRDGQRLFQNWVARLAPG